MQELNGLRAQAFQVQVRTSPLLSTRLTISLGYYRVDTMADGSVNGVREETKASAKAAMKSIREEGQASWYDLCNLEHVAYETAKHTTFPELRQAWASIEANGPAVANLRAMIELDRQLPQVAADIRIARAQCEAAVANLREAELLALVG